MTLTHLGKVKLTGRKITKMCPVANLEMLLFHKKIAYDIGVFITLTQGQSGKVKNRKNAKFISFYVEKIRY